MGPSRHSAAGRKNDSARQDRQYGDIFLPLRRRQLFSFRVYRSGLLSRLSPRSLTPLSQWRGGLAMPSVVFSIHKFDRGETKCWSNRVCLFCTRAHRSGPQSRTRLSHFTIGSSRAEAIFLWRVRQAPFRSRLCRNRRSHCRGGRLCGSNHLFSRLRRLSRRCRR